MKIVLAILFTLSMYTETIHASTLNKETLSLPIMTISGEIIQLNQYIGTKPIYLKFWASWCQPCIKQMLHFQRVQDKYNQDIIIIAINLGINDNVNSVNEVKNKFNLTMPIAIDKSGQLAKAFNLVGTPYHVLIDKNGNVIHTGHEASDTLDKKIASLTVNASQSIPNITLDTPQYKKLIIESDPTKITALFFTATWCDWYLKDSRPTISKNCIEAQNFVNHASHQFSQYNWLGVISRLWTGKKELDAFIKRYGIVYPVSVDTSNSIFLNYKVKNFPTLLLIRNGKEVLRIENFDRNESLSNQLKKYNTN